MHLGQNEIVPDHRIIGIFDLDNTTTSGRTREFLAAAEQAAAVVPCDELPKSFVLTAEYGMNRVYLTALGAAALARRAGEKKNRGAL